MDFDTRYATLNANQRQAVNYIHGSLLVIAGPGTGKTELLSMRAAQILRQTDTLPDSILCLTFTESGAANMRQRLRQIIGEDAYKIAIHTFHSFGTEIINQHREYFFHGADSQPADELTQHQIVTGILEGLDWRNPLSVKNNGEFVYTSELIRVISEFKQSGLTPAELRLVMADNQRVIADIAHDIQQVFATKISKKTIELFAPLAEKIAERIGEENAAKTSKEGATELSENAASSAPHHATPSAALPSSITPYAHVLALSIAHATQEAIDASSTKPLTAWKNKWCEKNAAGEFVLKDATASEKLSAAIDVYEAYGNVLAERSLFDYDDMILSVIQACEAHPELRANLQEQFQFIMVDEFQDTNLAQLRLLFDLTGDEDDPNIMAVGDDDQAIFSFQGADIGNIQRFRQHYHDPKIIVLTDNYRSAADILTAARGVITQGTDRLENTIDGLSKQLTAHASGNGARVEIQEFASVSEERAGVAQHIAELIKRGKDPAHITVIARHHKELIELLPYLYRQNLTVNYERHDDILEQNIIQTLDKLVRVVIAIHQNNLDVANSLLPEVIAHPAFGFSALDIWRLSLHAYNNRQLWLESMLANSTFQPFGEWLLERAKDVPNLPLEEQLDKLLGLEIDAGITPIDSSLRAGRQRTLGLQSLHGVDQSNSSSACSDKSSLPPTNEDVRATIAVRSPSEDSSRNSLAAHYFSPEALAEHPDAYLTTLESLRTLRQKLRDRVTDEIPTLADFLEFINLHRSTKTRLTHIRPQASALGGAINLMTAHKSKGLEFPHVFVIGAIDSAWGEKVRSRSRLIRYPANLQLQPAGASYDERLRLFFVAMTRAKTTLTMTYSQTNDAGSDTMIASFLTDHAPTIIPAADTPTAQMTVAHTDWSTRLSAPMTAELKDVLAPTLETYKLSITHLNNFLDVSRGGPQNFLLNNLLRFPSAKSPAASYGTAIHASLQQLHNLLRTDHYLPPAEHILHHFRTSLEAQHLPPGDFELYLDKGTAALTAFLDAKSSDFRDTELAEFDFAHQGVVVGGARLTGKLDVADIDKHNKTIFVTDYKTGKPSHSWKGTSDYEKIKLHKYRQQLMFYQLLVTSSRDYGNFSFTGARLQFVEPDTKTGDILSLEDTFSEEELAEFARLINVVWRKITTLELPDISGYSADYKGMVQFEEDLLAEAE
ncbi:UvrD-helicase domain-containing protein [Candidatus Saccharibacteria bacterium oral taxon 488]|nr:UvrD-helicase domain-containing protein [Candidatus Saccharibacteria bacterium oral taxon 488]